MLLPCASDGCAYFQKTFCLCQAQRVVMIMGVPEVSVQNSSAILNKNKIPDYAKDYKNEYLFIRGIDKACKDLYIELYYEDKEIFKRAQFEKMKRLISKIEKAQKLGYKDICESDVVNSILLYDSLIDMGDYYYDYDTEYDQKIYENLIDADFPGYIDFVRSIELFHSKFKIKEIEISQYKDSWYDSDSDEDWIASMLDSDSDSDSDSDY